MSKKASYRRILILCTIFGILLLGIFGYLRIRNAVPDEIKLVAESNESNIPKDQLHLNKDYPISFGDGSSGQDTVKCKLFGLIDLKDVKVSVVKDQKLIPGGTPIGIYMETKGVLIIGTGTVTGMDGLNYEPAYHLVKTGDYIEAVNAEPIYNKTDLIEKVNQYGNEEVILNIRRNEEEIQLKVKPVMTAPEEYRLGIWVRDNTQGIGTLTFIDENGRFGALGHGITDVDTSTLMEMDDGKLYETKILSIIKGEKGSPGEMTGFIDYNDANVRGQIKDNTEAGIFGIANDALKQEVAAEPMDICMKQDIELGPATIRCCASGEVKEYQVEIKEVNMTGDDVNKGIVLEITDPELLNLTGGIIQGMSGSPIIQNNKIIGAVTHVFIQDSSRGFGIFIETMLQMESDNQ